MMIKKSIFALLFLSLACQLLSQNYYIRKFDPSHGLSGSTVYAFHQDSLGFLWLETDKGVCRYDGKEFLPMDDKSQLAKDESEIQIPDSLPVVPQGFEKVIQHSTGTWWAVFGQRGGLHRYYNSRWEKVLGGDNLIIYDLIEDGEFGIWTATRNGLFRIIDNQFREVYAFHEIKNEIINKLFIDRDQNIWASSYGKGVFCLEENIFSNQIYPESFQGSMATILFKDHESRVWIAAADFGLIRKSVSYSRSFNTYKQFGSHEITCGIEYNNEFLFGGEGIFLRYADTTLTEIHFENLPEYYIVNSICATGDSLLLLINNESLWSLKSGKMEKTDIRLPEMSSAFYRDQAGNLFILSLSGLFLLDPQEREVHKIQMPEDCQVYVALSTSDSLLWVGTDKGLFQLENLHTVNHITTEKGLISNKIHALGSDGKYLHIGTSDGLSVMHNDSIITTFTSSDGLINSRIRIRGIVEMEGKMLIAGGNGISLLLPNWEHRNKESSYPAYTQSQPRSAISLYLPISLFVIGLLLLGLYYRKKRSAKKQNGNQKYATSSLREFGYAELKMAIHDLLIEGKLFLDPDISISVLSDKIGYSREHISQVINTEYEMNFNTLINQLRVDEARNLLADPAWEKRSIVEIVFESGFRSKSAFNTSFKKLTGMTPTEYKRKIRSAPH